MDYNPYAPPKTDVDGAETSDALELAGKGRRFANLLLDTVFYQLVVFAAGFVLVLLDPANAQAVEDFDIAITALVILAYYVGFETLMGRTPGKMITGTRVVTDEGLPPGLNQVFLRSASRLVPFEPFSCLGDPPEGWHDRWSRTRVVRTHPSGTSNPAYRLSNADGMSRRSSLGLS